MPFFSRLTDIVTCNLTTLLSKTEDPRQALEEIIAEMTEGTLGAERSVQTAVNNVARIEAEIAAQRPDVTAWVNQARAHLMADNDELARQALARKNEVEDLIAGLEQQLQAALATRDHLQTMMNALVARLADARRRREMWSANEETVVGPLPTPAPGPAVSSKSSNRIESELEALRRQCRGE
ncbi:PspA/IM30 family protein [Planctomicrobium sp. SH664]|uniref:PspA/IM30 family protein n=1 Tax=Planctomicrobium sp. SH664 TaxID=3448125 RepID=UPI003F5C059D